MLSLIICSRTSKISDELEKNIVETIGCEYELIVIDNSKKKYNIFQAYNEGIKLAKGDILCFMHEDIQFHTPKWGIITMSYFKDKTIGLVGVIGTHYMPKSPAAWWKTHYLAGQLIQGNFVNNVYKTKKILYDQYNESHTSLVEACTIDGLWFCMPKSIFDTIKFDDLLYHGFHCYDMDICMQVIQSRYKVMISNDILIEHLSIGTCDELWIDNLNIWYKKWRKFLPIFIGINKCLLSPENKYEVLIDNLQFCQNQFYKKYKYKVYRIRLALLSKWKKYL